MNESKGKLLLILLGLLGILIMNSACSTTSQSIRDMEQEVNIGEDLEKEMMQCRVLCNADKVYAYTNKGLKCQCQRPAEANASPAPILRFEVAEGASEASYKGVMGQLLNGKVLISTVKEK